MRSQDKDFLAEADDILNEAANLLLNIQDSLPDLPDPDSINGLFRAMHTLKGMAGLYGDDCVSDISHSLEGVLDKVRMGKADMTADTASFIFKYLDVLRAQLSDSGRAMNPKDLATCVSEIEKFTASTASKDDDEDPLNQLSEHKKILDVLSEYEEHRLRSTLKEGKGIYKLIVHYSIEDFDIRLKELSADIKKAGEIISTIPASDGVPPGHIGFTIVVGTSAPSENLSGLEVKEFSIMSESVQDQADVSPQTAMEQELKTTDTTVRVDIRKLDRLLNSVGEMALIKNNARALWKEMSDEFGRSHLVIELYKLVQQMER